MIRFLLKTEWTLRRDVGDSPTDQVQEDMDSEVYPSEDGKQTRKYLRANFM